MGTQQDLFRRLPLSFEDNLNLQDQTAFWRLLARLGRMENHPLEEGHVPKLKLQSTISHEARDRKDYETIKGLSESQESPEHRQSTF